MRIAFFGTPEFGRTVLEALLDAGEEIVLVVSQPDRPRQQRGRGPEEPSAVKALAVERGLSVITPERAGEALAKLESAQPDVCVVAAYGQILPDELLQSANGRWINVHGSLLPKYRGASPVSQAILDGLTETGVTIMEMVPELDAGAILTQQTVPITDNDTTGSLSEKLAQAGGALLVKTLPKYQSGLTTTAQDDSKVSMTHTLKKSDGRIDWSKDADYLARFVRAMQPWPGAWTELDGNRLTISMAASVPGSVKPGAFNNNAPLTVGTGKGLLQIERLTPAGKSEMDGSAWLNGIRQAGHFDS